MKIDYSSYKKALSTLERALNRSHANPSDEELRDAVIQRFEYTYELAWKMLKRTLEQEAASSPEIDQMSFKEMIRLAAERGYLSNPEQWFVYREMRNLTSHAYDQLKAQEVHRAVQSFFDDASKLLASLERKTVA